MLPFWNAPSPPSGSPRWRWRSTRRAVRRRNPRCSSAVSARWPRKRIRIDSWSKMKSLQRRSERGAGKRRHRQSRPVEWGSRQTKGQKQPGRYSYELENDATAFARSAFRPPRPTIFGQVGKMNGRNYAPGIQLPCRPCRAAHRRPIRPSPKITRVPGSGTLVKVPVDNWRRMRPPETFESS